jgi:hypothetical protein
MLTKSEYKPSALCRCDKPEPDIRLEDRYGKIIERICLKCRGAIPSPEEVDKYTFPELFAARQAVIRTLTEVLLIKIFEWANDPYKLPYSPWKFFYASAFYYSPYTRHLWRPNIYAYSEMFWRIKAGI